jgi:serine/threonine-protein kinase HipA
MSVQTLEVRLRFSAEADVTVGKLATVGRSQVFQYADSFLSRPLPLSPFRLPVRPGVQVFDGQGRMEVFGVFEDALPDSWGRRLVDKHFQTTCGRFPSVLERLAYASERAMGALTFYPPAACEPLPNRSLDLAGLASEAWAFNDDTIEDALPELQRIAGTSGGARPKILVGLPEKGSRKKRVLPGDGDLPQGYAHWIVKFNTRAEGAEAGPLEYAYAECAASAGADVPEHRLIDTSAGSFYAVRRFDRTVANRRSHLHSAAGLLHADFRTPGDEYDVVFRLTEALTRDYAQKLELFRRVCLNVLASNRDDHLKNFAFLMSAEGVWNLAPLFDFTFNTGPNGWHTLTVAGEGQNPRRRDLLRLAEQVDIRRGEAIAIIDHVRAAVSRFVQISKDLPISRRTQSNLQRLFRTLDA